MGFFENFLGSFFGYAAVETQKEVERKEKENNVWNNKFNELSQYEEELNSLLKSIGSSAIYIFDVDCIDGGFADSEIRRIEMYKKQIIQYISMGGDGTFIYDISKMDDYLLKIDLLKNCDALDRQIVFAANTYAETKRILEDEKLDVTILTQNLKTSSFVESDFSNIISDFELESIIGDYYFNAYQYYINEKSVNPLRAVCGTVSILVKAIDSKFLAYTNTPEDLITQDELNLLIDLLESQLMILISNPSLNSKKGRYIYYTSLMIAAELSFWRGRFAKSVAYFTTVLDEWTEAMEESFGFTTEVIASIFSMLNIMGLNDYVDLYFNKYKSVLESELDQYRNMIGSDTSNASMDEYYKEQISKIENRNLTNSFIMLSLVNIMDWTKTQMYDTGLEFGYADVLFGSYRLNVNKDSNSLLLYMQNSENTEKKEGTTLIFNLDKVIERERNEFLSLVSK